MPVTRSASKTAASRSTTEAASATAAKSGKPSKATSNRAKPSSVKRTSSNLNSNSKQQLGNASTKDSHVTNAEVQAPPATVPSDVMELYTAPTFLPATLSFSLEDAKRHLIEADPRFEDVFSKLKCRPFEHLERVDPFRTLATSILGQQISWLAARSITHRFIRLFDPSLPEAPPPSSSWSPDSFFPSARQVLKADIATLRTAGLSGRKAEYILDLAAKFADGTLSTEKIFQASDEELAEMLIAVRGIGRWTVDMFAMFSLRRPDILPFGDLGVQRGIARWVLSLHSPTDPVMISPKKLPDTQNEGPKAEGSSQNIQIRINGQSSTQIDVSSTQEMQETQTSARATTPDMSSLPPIDLPATPVTPVRGLARNGTDDVVMEAASGYGIEIAAPPPAFTPSINRTLNKALPPQYHAHPLPAGLTIQELRTRLTGKKKIRGAMLTPQEMEELTQTWRPYRSVGVYYMWALAEGDKS